MIFFYLTIISQLAQTSFLISSVSFFSMVMILLCFCSVHWNIHNIQLGQIGILWPLHLLCGIFVNSFQCPLTRQLPLQKRNSCSKNILRSSFYHPASTLSWFSCLIDYLLFPSLFSAFFGGSFAFQFIASESSAWTFDWILLNHTALF